MRALVLIALLAPAIAGADDSEPCTDSVNDPVITPVRDRLLDAQRSACMRDELSAGLLAHALIDTPGFRGLLGGGLVLGGRLVIAKAHELSVQLPLPDYAFVQNAVNKVTHLSAGPIVIGGVAGGTIGRGAHAALVLRVELPYTHTDFDTTHVAAQLGGVVTGSLARRLVLHGRLATIGRVASSLGGTTKRLAFVSGVDLAWHARTRLALSFGADVMGGWDAGLDHVLARLGAHWRVRGGDWRLRFGVGVPVAGDERTNAVIDIALVVDR